MDSSVPEIHRADLINDEPEQWLQRCIRVLDQRQIFKSLRADSYSHSPDISSRALPIGIHPMLESVNLKTRENENVRECARCL